MSEWKRRQVRSWSADTRFQEHMGPSQPGCLITQTPTNSRPLEDGKAIKAGRTGPTALPNSISSLFAPNHMKCPSKVLV